MVNSDCRNNSTLRPINDYKYTELAIELEFFALYKKWNCISLITSFINYSWIIYMLYIINN